MKRQQTFNRFQLNDNAIGNNKVEAVTGIHTEPFIFDRQLQLADKSQIAKTQFHGETLLISRLKQSWPERTMHLDRSTNNLLG